MVSCPEAKTVPLGTPPEMVWGFHTQPLSALTAIEIKAHRIDARDGGDEALDAVAHPGEFAEVDARRAGKL